MPQTRIFLGPSTPRCFRDKIFSALFAVIFFYVVCHPAVAQQAPQVVTIQVQADHSAGTISPIWNYFGYDEPNYTYAANGKKLLGELAAVGAPPVYVRVH